jgi:hypothetical protein
MATNRADFAGTGKLWGNGTLISEAAKVSMKSGGKIQRLVTLGYTGETKEDPTMSEIDIEGAVLKRDSLYTRLEGWSDREEDVTWKVQVGRITKIVIGKIHDLSLSTENGKSSFSAKVTGDKQAA